MTEFFLVLSSMGKAYRRCQLAWGNGNQVGVHFLKPGERKKNPESGKCNFCRLVEPAGLRPARFGCEAARRNLAAVSFQSETLNYARAATHKSAAALKQAEPSVQDYRGALPRRSLVH
jgi:hypothetical protein